MAQYPIGSGVDPIFPSGPGQTVTIFNNGPATVFLGRDTSLTPDTGYPLSVGGSMVWDAKNPLYATCGGSGNFTSTIFAIENSGSSTGTYTITVPTPTVNVQNGAGNIALFLVRSGKDSNGLFTIVDQYRVVGGKLALHSVLSGGSTPQYTTRVVTEYDVDGTTVLSTVTYTNTYDASGALVSETAVAS